jgi:hypothetical protein
MTHAQQTQLKKLMTGNEERIPRRTPPIRAGFNILSSFMKNLP